MDINPSEITKILKEQIKGFGEKTGFLKLARFYLSAMVLLEYTVWTTYKLEKWLNLKMVQKVWH